MTIPPEPAIPAGARSTGSSPQFTEGSTPAALRTRHALAKANWARLIVDAGALSYLDLDAGSRRRLAADESLVIGPEQAHRVEFDGPVVYHLDFFRTDS